MSETEKGYVSQKDWIPNAPPTNFNSQMLEASWVFIEHTHLPWRRRKREKQQLCLDLSPSFSLSLSTRCRRTHPPLERMRKHSSILGVGIIIIFRKYAHLPSRGRSGNGLQNLLKTELQHILLQEQQGLGFRDSFLGKSVKHVLVLQCQRVSIWCQIT